MFCELLLSCKFLVKCSAFKLESSMFSKIPKLQKLQQKTDAKIEKIGLSRIACFFLFFALTVYLNYAQLYLLELLSVLSFLILFTILLFCSRSHRNFSDKLLTLIEFYERQRQRTLGKPNASTLAINSEFADPIIKDLNLLGDHSVCQLLSECFSDKGIQLLADRMTKPCLTDAQILNQQSKTLRFMKYAGALRKLIVQARLSKKEILLTSPLFDFRNGKRLEKMQRIVMQLVIVFWFMCVVLTFAKAFGWIHFPLSYFWTFFALASLACLKISQESFKHSTSMTTQLGSFASVFSVVEALTLTDAKEYLPATTRHPMSRFFKKLNLVNSCLSTEANPIVHLILNGLSPWSVFWVLKYDQLKFETQLQLPETLSEFFELEYTTSLVMQKKYQATVFPIIDTTKISFEKMRHPLISKDKSVANSFQFEKKLTLITGSNMSGKSTFLRMFGVNQVLSLMGAAVYADKFTTINSPVMTCLQVSDSLAEGFSYFYSEVVRLKDILQVAREKRVLFLVDEIFKGTNNRERLIGSQSLIKELIGTQSTGFVTTHDLELTQLAEKFKDIDNRHFSDQVVDEKMTFNYLIQAGPCSSTNALKIMSLLGLPIT